MHSGTPVPAEAVFASPDHYLFGFEGDRALFRAMDRAAYHRSIFLDGRISTAGPEMFALPVAALAASAERFAPPRTGWIFHIAHCGSTLLARALDLTERSLVLREPFALRQIGIDRANPVAGPAGEAWRARLNLVAALAGRRYRSDAPAIVKANVPVNFVAADLLGLDPQAPSILLYFPLRLYLLAVLRSPGHRQWVVNVTTALRPALVERVGPIDGLAIPERAAALWLAQMQLFAEALALSPEARSLDADTLFDAPGATVAAAAAHLGVRLDAGEAETIAAGPLFAAHSKQPGQRFDNDARRALRTQVERTIAPELDRALAWLGAHPARAAVPVRLDRPLIVASPALLQD